MDTRAYWDSLIARSASRFFMLASLARRPMHGYELAKAIARACDNCCDPSDAMIYPAIRDLSQEGYIVCREERHGGRTRKVCELTERGWQAYRAAAEAWGHVLPYLSEAVTRGLLGPDCAPKGAEDADALRGRDQDCC
jgi:DNA-binding PadR family transcriptional regulator